MTTTARTPVRPEDIHFTRGAGGTHLKIVLVPRDPSIGGCDPHFVKVTRQRGGGYLIECKHPAFNGHVDHFEGPDGARAFVARKINEVTR